MSARLAVLFVFAATAAGQQDPAAPGPVSPGPVSPGPVSPAQQLQAKLAEPFLTQNDWITDYDLVRARAAAGGKLIFGYFTTAGY